MYKKITENVENVSLLSDTPALSPTELKRQFDKGSKIIKEHFNSFVDELNENDENQKKTNEKINNLPIHQYELTSLGTTYGVSTWSKIYNDCTTDKIPVGKYLIIFPTTITTNDSGSYIGGIRITIDGTELSPQQRQTMPLVGALISSVTMCAFVEFKEEKEHVLNCEIYGTGKTSCRYSSNVTIIKINDEIEEDEA